MLDLYWSRDYRGRLIAVAVAGVVLGVLQQLYRVLAGLGVFDAFVAPSGLGGYVLLPSELDVSASVLGVSVTVVVARSAFRLLGGSLVSVTEEHRLDSTLDTVNTLLGLYLVTVAVNNLLAPGVWSGPNALIRDAMPALFFATVTVGIVCAPIRLGVSNRTVGRQERRAAAAQLGLVAMEAATGGRVRRNWLMRGLVESAVCVLLVVALTLSMTLTPLLSGSFTPDEALVIFSGVGVVVALTTSMGRVVAAAAGSGVISSVVDTTVATGRPGSGWPATIGTAVATASPLLVAGWIAWALRSGPDPAVHAHVGAWETLVSWLLGLVTTLVFWWRYRALPRSVTPRRALAAIPQMQARVELEQATLSELTRRQSVIDALRRSR